MATLFELVQPVLLDILIEALKAVRESGVDGTVPVYLNVVF